MDNNLMLLAAGYSSVITFTSYFVYVLATADAITFCTVEDQTSGRWASCPNIL